MKLFNIYQNFDLIKKAYDNCSYERVFQLLDGYNEIKERIKTADEKRQEIVKKFADEDGNIPDDKKEEADKEFRELMESEIELKHNLRFTQKDFEGSDITGSDIATLYEMGLVAKSGGKSGNKKKK